MLLILDALKDRPCFIYCAESYGLKWGILIFIMCFYMNVYIFVTHYCDT